MNRKFGIGLGVGLIVVALGQTAWRLNHRPNTVPAPAISTPVAATPVAEPTPTPPAVPSVVAPINQFKERITKKLFGTNITPATSPVQPEKFSGYHTGVDVEYTDTTTDVPVLAIADGTVRLSKWATGYGGVMAIEHQINGRTLYAIYGHLRQSSMVAVGATVTQVQQIAVLGTGYSHETDGERRHLHFGLATSLTIKGYVANTAELVGWLDPLSLYK